MNKGQARGVQPPQYDPAPVKLILDIGTGSILDASESAADFYGWPLEQLKRMTIFQINTLPPETVRAEMAKASTAECNWFTFHHRRVDGTLRQVEVFSSTIPYQGREALHSIIYDVTERNRVQEALQRSEERFREVLENALDAAYKRDLGSTSFEYVSPVFSRIAGYAPEEVLTWTDDQVKERIHPDDREAVDRLKRESLTRAAGAPQQIEYRFRHHKGHYIWLLDRFNLLRDAEGRAISRIGSLSDVTVRKKTEQILAHERRQMESIIAGTGIGTWEWNVQTGDLTVNDRWAEILGYTPAELAPICAGTWKKFVSSKDRIRVGTLLEQHFTGRTPFYECEYRMRHKNGSWKWIHSSGSLITRTAAGEPLIMYGAHTDISARKRIEAELKQSHAHLKSQVWTSTADLVAANRCLRREMEERKRVETVLRENEERYRRITEGLTDFIYTVLIRDGKATATIRSPACIAVTGYTPEEYNQDPSLWMRMVVEQDRPLVIAYFKHVLAEQQGPPVEYRIRHKDGRIRWVSDKLIPQTNGQGAVTTYDGVINDITPRKLTEQQLHHSKATLTMAMDGMSDPLLMLDAELRVVQINKAALAYFGLTDDRQPLGKRCFAAFKGRTRPCPGCERPLSGIHGFSGSFERKGSMDATRLEQVVVDEVKDAAGRPQAYIIRISDITNERMLDRQLVQSEKLASLGLLAAGIAHEINNPNNFIFFNTPILRSYLQFLLPIADQYAASQPDLEVFNRPYAMFRQDCFNLVDNIEHGSTRINQIVGELREFVRERGQGERRMTDLKEVVNKAINICLGRIRKSVKKFETQVCERVPPLLTDPLAVEQVVVNLLINAVQALDKDDSSVRLTIRKRPPPEEEICIEVSDNGCGMDEETLGKIFDPFFTTKAPGVGTGLGLSICHRLITELGGRIEVTSRVGAGSVFRVLLKEPRHQPPK